MSFSFCWSFVPAIPKSARDLITRHFSSATPMALKVLQHPYVAIYCVAQNR
jgi:hypothetical protein